MATGLIYRGNMNADGGRILKNFLLADSTAFTLGDAVKSDGTTGTLILWGAGGAGLGPITAFQKADGSPVTDNGSSAAFTNTYTTPASNTVVAVVDVSTNSLYSIDADATLGTTAGSNKFGVNMDLLAASDQLDESTAAATTASFYSFGPDTAVDAATDAVIVKIQESQIKL